VPATFVVMVAWWLWYQRSASRVGGDEEKGKDAKAD